MGSDIPLREQCCLDTCERSYLLQYSHIIGVTRYLYCSAECQQEALAKHSKGSAARKDFAHA
jgi:hypothetical protein